jgi:sulfopyruvate decarboxylase subunit alpha
MAAFSHKVDLAEDLCNELIDAEFGPFLGTPCGARSPLYAALHERVGVLTVARMDNAIGVAAGTALAGHTPAVLMHHAGLGQAMNAIAALVIPYQIPMLLVVSTCTATAAPIQENVIMSRLTTPLLSGLGMDGIQIDPAEPLRAQVEIVRDTVRTRLQPAVLRVPPDADGWLA